MLKHKWLYSVGIASLMFSVSGCGHQVRDVVHSPSELLPALLTVSDMPTELASTPVEWYENMRKVISDPAPPWENTLDPYLCDEAGVPAALTHDQVQLELTGGSIMEILLSADNAIDLYRELKDAYITCAGDTTPSYTRLEDIEEVGNESVTYKSADGIVTIAVFENNIMILKWWVGEFYDRVAGDYPGIVATAASKVEAL